MRSIDITVLVIYFLAVTVLGIRLRGRQRDANDYFTASGTFSAFWAPLLIGLSLAATLFSGISFVIYASVAYSDGAQILLATVCFPIVWLVLKVWFLPRYLSAGAQHPYDVLERRFGYGTRLLMSVMFVFMRIGWMGVLIYAPVMILMAAAGLNEGAFWPLILLVGLSATAYTTIGGIRGVIVTDALQFAIMVVGTGVIVAFILHRVPLSLTETLALLAEEGRLNVFDFSWDMTRPLTFWSVIFGLATVNVGTFVADQMTLQRYLAAGSVRTAIRSFSINMVGSLLVIVSLIAVGLLIWVWFRYFPDPDLPTKADEVIPFFIARNLPAGLAGLLLAAILAATMSSMTSGINSLAGSVTHDFVGRFWPKLNGFALLKIGRAASVAIGLFATVAGGLAGRSGSLLEVSQIALGLFLGPMLAVMVLAMNRRAVPRWSPAVALLAGILTGWAVVVSPIGALWVAPFSFAVSLTIPLIASRFRPQPTPL